MVFFVQFPAGLVQGDGGECFLAAAARGCGSFVFSQEGKIGLVGFFDFVGYGVSDAGWQLAEIGIVQQFLLFGQMALEFLFG